MDSNADKRIKEIISLYSVNNSILETARVAGMSTVKVRKILITVGLWESDTSIKIGSLLQQGLTTEEIARKLFMSVKNVQAYTPYERGLYGTGDLSEEAIRSEKYRNRMKKAASMQVVKRKYGENLPERMMDMMDEKLTEVEKVHSDGLGVLKLHLELNMEYADEVDRQILKKYGSMRQSISRDILAPSDITLHALNYAILRMFGWQNGHLHHYSLPEDVFQELTENKFLTWTKMAGVYFRFPTDDYTDLYWDDDYREGESVRSWMKKKYTGPYKYKGYGEHYLLNQIEVQSLFSRCEEITVREFDFRAEKQPEPYRVKLKDATVEQVAYAYADGTFDELLERLPLADVLCVKGKTKPNLEQIREYIKDEAVKTDVSTAIKDYRNARFSSMKREQDFLWNYDIPVLPLTDQLIYHYDYGDGWEIRIHCENAYIRDENGEWNGVNSEMSDVLSDDLETVTAKHRPICIAKDGIELVDDVGGIGGFCEMLQTIYGCSADNEEELEEKNNMLAWADMMGWTGRKINPKQTL